MVAGPAGDAGNQAFPILAGGIAVLTAYLHTLCMETAYTSSRDRLRAMSGRLWQQWPTVNPQCLGDLALNMWRDERLRALPARKASEVWLQPVTLRE